MDTLIGIEHVSGTHLRRHTDRRRRRQLDLGRLERLRRHRQRHPVRQWRQRPHLGRHRQPHIWTAAPTTTPCPSSPTRPTSLPTASPSRCCSRAARRTTEQGLMVLTGFENLSGSIYDDSLTGDGNDNVLLGDIGNDSICPAASATTRSTATAAPVSTPTTPAAPARSSLMPTSACCPSPARPVTTCSRAATATT